MGLLVLLASVCALPVLHAAENVITLATTTSTENSGLLDKINPAFEKKTGIKVKVIALGTGAAIKCAREGNADLILVHARAREDKLVAEGYKNREIADELFISIKTVEKHRSNLMAKLNLHGAAELAKLAIEKGLVEKPSGI